MNVAMDYGVQSAGEDATDIDLELVKYASGGGG